MKQVSRRRFLAAVAGLGGISTLTGLGWIGSACGDDSGDDGLVLDDADGQGSPSPTAPEDATSPETSEPDGEPTGEASGTPPPTATETASETPPAETPTAEPTETPSGELGGYRYPMDGISIPGKSSQLPNAARDYRCGYHEGVDFYPYDSGPFFGRDASVYAARSGEVIRADHQYSEYSTAGREADLSTICAQGGDGAILDHLRGRQVWISHDDGNTTRYCHLNSVNSALSVGQRIDAGGVVGGTGNSGTSNGALGTEMDIHLHFEVRLGGRDGPYLGSGQPESEIRRLLAQLFA